MPVRMFRDIHPFGKELGNSTIDYTSFTPQVLTRPERERHFGSGAVRAPYNSAYLRPFTQHSLV